MKGSFLDGFFTGNRYSTKTKKQKLETRIKDSVLNLVIEQDQSFLHTARKNNTSIIVNNRDGRIQEFNYDGRRYISFPSSFEDKLADMQDFQAEEYLDDIIKMATVSSNIEDYQENEMELLQKDKLSKYKSITGKELKVDEQLYEYRASKSEEENKKDKEEGEAGNESGTSVTSSGMTEESSAGSCTADIQVNTSKVQEYKFQDTDLSLDGELPREIEQSRFFDNEGYCNDYKINSHDEVHLQALANQILKSFKGRIFKNKTLVPSKKLVAKSLILDNSEKIYQNKKGSNGKHLNVNLIIDMSGSMSGEPVLNATKMIYIFNEIAMKGKLKGNVIWSESSSRCKVPFPMPRKFIKNMLATGGAEGLGKNLKHYIKELKEVDANICMTDGQLCDDAILKSFYAKEKVDIIGVYVNKDAEDLTEYTGSLDRWFSKSLVRRNIDELCEKLVQLGLRKKGK